MAEPERRDRRTEDQENERRAEDAGTSTATEDRGQALMRRFRQPLIGLGLAGLAFPLVKATTPMETMRTAGSDSSDQADAPDAMTRTASQDTEDALAEQIGMSQEEQERERQIEAAMEDFNISRDLAEDIYDVARETKVEPKLAFGLIRTESTFNERAVSPVGARGLTQVMPRTAAWLVPGTTTQDLFDRQTNLRLGFRYLNQMIDKYEGNVRLALLAYNRGPGTVDKVLRQGGDPNNGYADKVLGG
jgi:soluble lytic murein transglycosylase-like protein